MTPDFSQPIVLFGGSFDPIHSGHLHVAGELQKAFPSARVVFVPAHESPGKRATASGALRLELVKLALVGTPFLAWDEEINRPGPSYTVHTLEKAHTLGAARERLYWALGADSYSGLASSWHQQAKLRALCDLVVVARPGAPLVAQNPHDKILQIPLHEASSRRVRDALKTGATAEEWLPEAVLKHLKKLSLNSENPYGKN